MKINYIDEDTIDIYIMKDKLNINFDSEKGLKELFKVLKDNYSINIEGFYDVCIYVDKYYGVVIHMVKENSYFNCYKDIEMRITIKDSIFLYQIDDYIESKKIHIIDNNMYLEITDSKDLINIIENTNYILYDYSK